MSAAADNDALDTLVERVVHVWPQHKTYIEKSLAERSPETIGVSREVAACVLRIARSTEGGLDRLCGDYRFFCEKIILKEEIHFRRHGRYRLSTFEEANRECYTNPAFMACNMNGLLLSNVLWANHAQAIADYKLNYLMSLHRGADHLEIGPGHGLLLCFAANSPNVGTATAWEVSPTSLESTRSAMEALQPQRPAKLQLQNLLDIQTPNPCFDSIVMSEILEHIENPIEALKSALALLRPGGLLWVNVPANSPAPDHIFLVESPEQACELVRAAGFDVIGSAAFPMTGASLEKAVRQKLSVSCVVYGRAPHQPN